MGWVRFRVLENVQEPWQQWWKQPNLSQQEIVRDLTPVPVAVTGYESARAL